ncbi:MAG: FecR family protein [Saprospiraceae bacterium]|nr:FecR family protein [Saprospiraceae bacterium]
MTQQEFNELAKRYLEGKTNFEEDMKIQVWYESQPEFHQNSYPDKVFQKVGKRIERKLLQNARKTSTRRIVSAAWVLGIAIGMILAFVWLSRFELPLLPKKDLEQAPSAIAQHGIELKNTDSSDQKITLPDGSLIILKPGSSLVYDKDFNKSKRELHLHGEAFFEVAKNPGKPFIVHAGEVVAEVVGTSFSIKNAENFKDVEVDVITGKVSVYAEKKSRIETNSISENPEVILTPNQKVKYLNAENRLVKSIVAQPKFIISKEELVKLSFVEAPISQIFEAIEKAYGLEIIYDEVVMHDCAMTTSLDEENLHDKLAIICKLLNASYKMIDAQIVISSEGCH